MSSGGGGGRAGDVAGGGSVAERDGLRESVRSRYVTSDVTGALSLINVIRIRQADAIEPNINAEANWLDVSAEIVTSNPPRIFFPRMRSGG